jgi:hypothetical protein
LNIASYISNGYQYGIGRVSILIRYYYQVIGNLTKEGNVLSRNAGFWNTPSTGELAFLNDMMSVFKLEVDREGNLSAVEWEWK